MRKFDVQIALEGVREAREKWTAAKQEFDSNMDFVMSRLLHEAAANFMSAAEVGKHAGLPSTKVRRLMRRMGMDPKSGKRLLAKHAAEALAENSALLGIEPHEMDLTSPLAYLPMGEELKQRLTDARVHRVTELPEDNPLDEFVCPVPGCNCDIDYRTGDAPVSGNVDLAQFRRDSIAEFVGAMSADYRWHTGIAVREDMVFACIRFGVDPEVWYDNPSEAAELKAQIAYHREAGRYA